MLVNRVQKSRRSSGPIDIPDFITNSRYFRFLSRYVVFLHGCSGSIGVDMARVFG